MPAAQVLAQERFVLEYERKLEIVELKDIQDAYEEIRFAHERYQLEDYKKSLSYLQTAAKNLRRAKKYADKIILYAQVLDKLRLKDEQSQGLQRKPGSKGMLYAVLEFDATLKNLIERVGDTLQNRIKQRSPSVQGEFIDILGLLIHVMDDIETLFTNEERIVRNIPQKPAAKSSSSFWQKIPFLRRFSSRKYQKTG